MAPGTGSAKFRWFADRDRRAASGNRGPATRYPVGVVCKQSRRLEAGESERRNSANTSLVAKYRLRNLSVQAPNPGAATQSNSPHATISADVIHNFLS